jgi:hypothetical protein
MVIAAYGLGFVLAAIGFWCFTRAVVLVWPEPTVVEQKRIAWAAPVVRVKVKQ